MNREVHVRSLWGAEDEISSVYPAKFGFHRELATDLSLNLMFWAINPAFAVRRNILKMQGNEKFPEPRSSLQTWLRFRRAMISSYYYTIKPSFFKKNF